MISGSCSRRATALFSRTEVEQIEMVSMVRAGDELNDARWSPRYRDALKQAALATRGGANFRQSNHQTSIVRPRNRPKLVAQAAAMVGTRRSLSRPAGFARPIPINAHRKSRSRSMTVATPITVGCQDIVQSILSPRPH